MIKSVRYEGLGRKLTDAEIAKLRALWASIPGVQCKGLCVDECTHVPIAPIEAYYLIEKYDAKIQPSRHAGPEVMIPTLGADHTRCQFLTVDDRCSIYDDRPQVCRQYGHPVLTLACKHGCTQDRPLTFLESTMLTAAAMDMLEPGPITTWEGFTGMFDRMTVLVETSDELLPIGETA